MKKILLSVVLLAGILIGGISLYTPPKNSENLTTLKIATHKIPLAAPFIIAKEKGLFEKNGLNAEITYFTTGLETLHALTESNVDIASSGTTPYVNLSFQRDDVKILNQVSLSNDIQILARKDTGIYSLQDLQLKKIGFVKGTITELAIIHLLDEASISKDEYTLIEFNQPIALPTALANKDIDAYCAWEPFISNGIKSLDANLVTVFGSEKGLYPLRYLSTTKSDFATQKNRKILESFNISLLEADQFIQKNPEESIAIVSKVVGMEKESLAQIWSKYDFSLSLKKELLDDLNTQKDWFKKEGAPLDPDYRKYIETDFLQKLLPHEITL